MSTLSVIELFKEHIGFAAGHFTVFSATNRERLHGHNYRVYCALTTSVSELGLSFDYREYENQLVRICKSLQQIFLLPLHCPHLKFEEQGDFLYVHFHNEKIPFLRKDVLLLPIKNITVEELSNWFLVQLLANEEQLQKHAIQEIVIKVYSAPGQSGSAVWKKK